MTQTKKQLSTPAALLIGCIIGVVMMILLPNPLDKAIGNTEQNLVTAAEQKAIDSLHAAQLAQLASADGNHGLEALCEAISESDREQSLALLSAAPAEKLSDELKRAIEASLENTENVYADYRKVAEKEGNADGIRLFEAMSGAEVNHTALLQEAEELLARRLPSDYYLCGCGAIYRDNPPDVCELCGNEKSHFQKFNG